MRCRLAWIVVGLSVARVTAAQVVVDASAVLTWETPAEVTMLTDVGRVFAFRAYLDDTTALPITPTCTGTTAPFTCEARGVLAGVPIGAHTLRMSTTALGREGAWSGPLAFTLAPPAPGPPINLKLVISATNAQGQSVPLTITVR